MNVRVAHLVKLSIYLRILAMTNQKFLNVLLVNDMMLLPKSASMILKRNLMIPKKMIQNLVVLIQSANVTRFMMTLPNNVRIALQVNWQIPMEKIVLIHYNCAIPRAKCNWAKQNAINAKPVEHDMILLPKNAVLQLKMQSVNAIRN